MTDKDALANCQWHEPGGLAAAQSIAAFLDGIGIAVRVGPIAGGGFLAGMGIAGGAIVIDPEAEVWPGDMLHEAGHLAVTEPERRATLSDVGTDPGEEMAAIAWSVAAAHASGIALEVLFHPGGYKGGSQSLIDNFSEGRSFGVPLLAWYGLTNDPARGETPCFPEMLRWLR